MVNQIIKYKYFNLINVEETIKYKKKYQSYIIYLFT